MQEYYISRTIFLFVFRKFYPNKATQATRHERIRHLPARPERAEAPSPGHRPGYSGFYEYALKGQKFYKQLKLEII